MTISQGKTLRVRSFHHVMRSIAGWFVIVLAIILGVVGTVGAFFGAANLLDSSSLLFLIAFLVGLGVTSGLAWIAARILARARRGRIALSVGGATMLVLAVASSLTILQPLADTSHIQSPPLAPPSVSFWDLSTGSHIAYTKISAQGTAKANPVIQVGGGPGAPDVDTGEGGRYQSQHFDWLTRLGYDVYIYDQIGSGYSARLADPTQYTVARHVADLEAIRQHIGAPQVILDAGSWGGELTANYMAAHPDRVAKAIIESPTPINPAEWPKTVSITPATRLSAAEKQRYNALFKQPRFLLWMQLLQINPIAAHNLVSDQEADAFMGKLFQSAINGVTCNPNQIPTPRDIPQGFGFYDNIFTTNDAQTKHAGPNPRTLLASNRTPTLLMVGECNYIKWDVAYQYKTTLPNSTLLYFPHAGHVIDRDQPDLYHASIRAFLLGTPLPLRPYTGTKPPA